MPVITLKERHRKIITLVREQSDKLILAMSCMLIFAGTTSASAWLVKPVIDEIFINKNTTGLKLLPLIVVAIYVLRGFALFGQEYLMEFIGQRIIRTLRNDLYTRIIDLPLGFLQQQKTGALMSRFTYDVNVIKAMVSTAVAGALRDALTIVGLTIIIFYMDWRMALFALIVLPFAFLPLIKFGRRVRRASTGVQESIGDMSAFLHETLLGNKVVKAFGMEAYEKKRFKDRTDAIFKREIKAAIAKSLSSPVMEFLGSIAVAMVVWFGGFNVIQGHSTPGTFFAFLTAVIMLYDPVKKLTKVNNAVQEGMASFNRVCDIVETESDIQDPLMPVAIPNAPHQVCFEHVSLKYDQTPVLTNIDLCAQPGQTLALVGMSGGGKTSLVNLIPRFFDVSEGCVQIDGLDIRKASIKSLRERIAIVTQEPILFNDTIASNIAYGRPDATREEIEEAARSAYAFDFIMSFPEAFETVVGELGGRLSGGEKQRLCIARALLKDAPILILDEATSSLDTEAESVVQKALENLMKGRTTFIIAHRLSTIRNADHIVVLKTGRIVESGSHEALLERKGEYYRLYQMQFQNETVSR